MRWNKPSPFSNKNEYFEKIQTNENPGPGQGQAPLWWVNTWWRDGREREVEAVCALWREAELQTSRQQETTRCERPALPAEVMVISVMPQRAISVWVGGLSVSGVCVNVHGDVDILGLDCHLRPFNVWVLCWAGPTTHQPPHSSTSTCLCSWGELSPDAGVEEMISWLSGGELASSASVNELTSWLSRGELFCPSSWQCRGAGPVGTDVEKLALMMWAQERQPHPSTVHYGRAGPGTWARESCWADQLSHHPGQDL